MNRLRVLMFAPDANPGGVTSALIGYCQAQALARLHDVTLLVTSSSEDAVRRHQGAVHSLEVIRLAWLERLYAFIIRWVFKGNFYNQLLQAMSFPFIVVREWQAWRQTRARIRSGEFDIVLRLLPAATYIPSPFAFFLRNGPVPFIIGPVNGGLPWPHGFRQAKAQNNTWICGLRRLYPFLPFAGSTYRCADAIMTGSSHTYTELSAHRERLFFLPENGIDSSICSHSLRVRDAGATLELIFLGSLIPLKACDLALRGAAHLLRDGLARLTVVGDGPERNRLEQLTRFLGVEKSVVFRGWLAHDQAMQQLRSADVLLFPSIRDFGGGVVFEALASGVVPVVADFGGPGDTIHPEIGCKVSLTNEDDVVLQLEQILVSLASDSGRLERLRHDGVSYARDYLSWDAKAKTITEIMYWVLGHGPKPLMPPPKTPSIEYAR